MANFEIFLPLNFSLTENGATLTYSIDCVYLVYSDLAIVFSDLPSLDQDSKVSSKKSGSGTYVLITCSHEFCKGAFTYDVRFLGSGAGSDFAKQAYVVNYTQYPIIRNGDQR